MSDVYELTEAEWEHWLSFCRALDAISNKHQMTVAQAMRVNDRETIQRAWDNLRADVDALGREYYPEGE